MVRVTTNSVNPPTTRSVLVNPYLALPCHSLVFFQSANLFGIKDVPFSSTCRKQSCCGKRQPACLSSLHDKDGTRARVWRVHEMMLHVARFSKIVNEGEGVVVLQANMHILYHYLCVQYLHRGDRACAETFARTRVPLVVDQS